MARHLLRWCTLFLSVLLGLAACGERPPAAGPQYQVAPPDPATRPVVHLAVHPLYNPSKLLQAYQPLVDHLNQALPQAHFVLEGATDYQAYEAKIRQGTPEFLLPNPWQALIALDHGYTVIAEAGDSADFRGIFLRRKDSPIRQFTDLKGATISYPSPTALAAAVMPQRYLFDHGVDVVRAVTHRYVGSQEASIRSALLGESDLAATWPPPWRLFQKDHPQEAAQLEVLWETPALVNNAVMVRRTVPTALAQQVQAVLLALADTPEGQAVLRASETSAFRPAQDRTYDRVRRYVADFERRVRPVEPRP